MLEIDKEALLKSQPEGIRQLYDKHAATLLGYLFEVVKDRKLAEEYLVLLFCELSRQYHNINWDSNNNWYQLQRFAKENLTVFRDTAADCEPANRQVTDHGNKHLDKLSTEQRFVFCEVYYHGKTVAEISAQLNKTEDLIRKTLREAFAIIRTGGEN